MKCDTNVWMGAHREAHLHGLSSFKCIWTLARARQKSQSCRGATTTHSLFAPPSHPAAFRGIFAAGVILP